MIWLELIGAGLSVLGVVLTARRHPWCWPVNLVASVVYGLVFVEARLYSDTLLQGAFCIMTVYGWVRWMQHLDRSGHVRIAPLAPRPAIIHILVGAAGALALGYVMQRWTDAALPWLDAALTAFSLVGQWWQARRHIAAWWLWIAVDVIYIGEYIYKDLHVTALLYAGFVALAVHGLRTWRRAALQPADHAG